jgi:AcrR family transcriptional regulator
MSRKKTSAKAHILRRKEPTQARAQATVEAILEAAAHILRDGGYAKLTTNRVAEIAGVSVGSLYQYFPSKDALVVALLLKWHEHNSQALMATLAECMGLPLREAVVRVVRLLYATHAKDPKLSAVLSEELGRVGSLAEIVEHLERTVREPLALYLASRASELAREDVHAAAFLLTHTVQPFMHRVAVHADASRRELLLAELIDMVTGYLVRPP